MARLHFMRCQQRESCFQSRVRELWKKLLAKATSIAPVRHAAEPHEIAGERRGGARDERERLTRGGAEIDHPERQAARPRTSPHAARGIQKLLERDRPLVAG